MILSDNQNCGGSVMTYSESNSRMPTLEPTAYCDMIHSSSADVPTFVAMLDDAYDMNIPYKITEDVCNRLEQFSDSENLAAMSSVSDDEEPMTVCDIPVKLERPKYLSIPQTKFSVTNATFHRQERKGDVLLSDHKALPDINFFIKTPKKNTVFTEEQECSPFELSAMDVDHPPGRINQISTCDVKTASYVDRNTRTNFEKQPVKLAITIDRSMEIPNSSSFQNIPHEQTNYQYFVKCENNHDNNYSSFASSVDEVADAQKQFIPIIEQHVPQINCCFPHPTSGSAFHLSQRFCPDNSAYHNPTYARHSPHYLSPADIVDQKGYLNHHPQDPSESSYSTSPCSNISSSTSPSENSISYPCSATVETRKGFQQSPTLQLEDGDDNNNTKMPHIVGELSGNFEPGTSVGSYMEEILNEVIKNVEVACIQLQLPSDPKLWTEEQVQNWVNWTIDQYKLPSSKDTQLRITGRRLCELNEADIRALAPESGDFLHAHLEIWKTVIESNNRCTNAGEHENSPILEVQNRAEVDEKRTGYSCENSTLDSHESRKGLQELKKAEDAIAVMTPNHTAGIHLWQFLKELLLQPQLYGKYIRWMDKDTGIFKIEDSVEVARLWGIRKNRPAMNYDKLSRSIRQYYKKGIIKKTEVSQRLVYQFVKPIL